MVSCTIDRHLGYITLAKSNNGPRQKAVAAKRFARSIDTSRTYLQESLPFKSLAEVTAGRSLPLVWDFTTVEGAIGEDRVFRGGNTYWVKNCTVTGATLTIEPGVTVKREAGTTFAIGANGRLVAVGEPYAMITFTSADDLNCGEAITNPAPAPGIPNDLLEIFQEQGNPPPSDPVTTLRYCKFTRGKFQLVTISRNLSNPIRDNVFLTASATSWYGLYSSMMGSNFTIKNNLFVSSPGQTDKLLAMYYVSSLVVESNTFSGAGGSAIDVSGSNVTIRENIFHQCVDPIYSGGATPASIVANAYVPFPPPPEDPESPDLTYPEQLE